MGVPATEVGYTSSTTERGDHELHKGHVEALGTKKRKNFPYVQGEKFVSFLA
jgi:hypothetical protein